MLGLSQGWGIHGGVFETQAWEALEIVIGRNENQTMLNGQGGKMRIGHQFGGYVW